MEVRVSTSYSESIKSPKVLTQGIIRGLRKCQVYEDDIEPMTQEILKGIWEEVYERAMSLLKLHGGESNTIARVDFVLTLTTACKDGEK